MKKKSFLYFVLCSWIVLAIVGIIGAETKDKKENKVEAAFEFSEDYSPDFSDELDGKYIREIFLWHRNDYTVYVECIRPRKSRFEKNILLVHGLTFSSHEFDVEYEDYSLVRRLADEGYAVWRLDITGYGLSEMVEDGFMPDTDYAADDINMVVENIVKTTGQDKIDILGWSWGTVTTSRFVKNNDEHINSIVLYAPLLTGVGDYEVKEPFTKIDWYFAVDDFQTKEDGNVDYDIMDPAVIGIYCSNCWCWDGDSSPNGGRRDICVPETEKLIDLDAIKKPTLIIYGDKDPYMNFKALDNVIDELPEGSRVEVIEGGAHSMMLEKPYHREFQDKIVDFLKSN